MTVWGGDGPLVTDTFTDLPLDEGITRLVRGHALILTYGPAPDGTSANALEEVRVYVGAAEAPPPPEKAVSPSSRHAKKTRARQLREVRELTRQGGEEAGAALAQLLVQDPDPVVRGQAAAALGRVGGGDADVALTVALNDPDSTVRLRAARALARLEGSQASHALTALLLGDTAPRVRREAARALRALGTDEARWVLELAASDPDPSVRRAAVGPPAAKKDAQPR